MGSTDSCRDLTGLLTHVRGRRSPSGCPALLVLSVQAPLPDSSVQTVQLVVALASAASTSLSTPTAQSGKAMRLSTFPSTDALARNRSRARRHRHAAAAELRSGHKPRHQPVPPLGCANAPEALARDARAVHRPALRHPQSSNLWPGTLTNQEPRILVSVPPATRTPFHIACGRHRGSRYTVFAQVSPHSSGDRASVS